MVSMTPEERKNAAEALKANPLFDATLALIETRYTETMIAAQSDVTRMEAQACIRAARAFRADILNALAEPQKRFTPV
jgi:hypothetical protein